MSKFEFIFFTALVCMTAQGMYSTAIQFSRPDISVGMRWLSSIISVAIDLGLAFAAAWLATNIEFGHAS